MAKRGSGSKREERRAFWFSWALSLFVFMTAAGLLAVDYQGRKLSFGDSTPPVSLDRQAQPPQLRIKAFGLEESFDAAGLDSAIDLLCDFGCIPHK